MMSEFFFQIGRQPLLSIAELAACGVKPTDAKNISQEGVIASMNIIDPKQFLAKLGGTLRIAAVIARDRSIETLLDAAADALRSPTKAVFGLSILGNGEKFLKKSLIALKKKIGSARFVNPNFENLSTAQAFHAGLWNGHGTELLIIPMKTGDFVLTRVIAGQDLENYARRDFEKPMRDAKVGMLPPKLAQILINLAQIHKGGRLWDPFCGLGTIPMEGLLMGFSVIGTDIEPRMVGASRKNVEWLRSIVNISLLENEILVHDARKKIPNSLCADAIVTEGFLGTPREQFVSEIEATTLDLELLALYGDFFTVITHSALRVVPIVLTLPVLRGTEGKVYKMEKTLARISEIGYRGAALLPTHESLCYGRPDQFVWREIRKFIHSPIAQR